MADGQVVIEITADNRRAIQAVEETTDAINHESREWENAADESSTAMGDKFASMFKKISAAAIAAKVGKAILDWGKQAVQAASDLAEVQNVVDVTFGESSAEIDRWAKDAINQFGLTETQAKRFTSTLGAMMKSAGMTGPEVATMSENLSGLAADMASFYNMDFDTAFQKIRSGISGETEPLKQLGINMSVANLEAYALTQGITKAFDEMSQAEQTQLRYQYLMQATADAQGDFARTSDGFANSLRKIKSNVDQITTSLGAPLLSAVEQALDGISRVIGALTKDTHNRTVLDDFAEIDDEVNKKLADIELSYTRANDLIDIVEELEAKGFVPDAVSKYAEGVNKLNSDSPSNWKAVLSAFSEHKDLADIWSGQSADNFVYTVDSLASALSGEQGGMARARAFGFVLDSMRENADGIAKYAGMNTEEVLAIIDGLETAATGLAPDDYVGWDNLLTTFATKVPNIMTLARLGVLQTRIGDIEFVGKSLDTTSVNNWEKFLSALHDAGIDFSNTFDETGDAATNISALAEALAAPGVTTQKARAWKTVLEAMTNNADDIAKLRGTDAKEAAEWLSTLAVDIDNIDFDNVEQVNRLFTYLFTELPGLENTDEGRAMMEALASATDSAVTATNNEANGLARLNDAQHEAAVAENTRIKALTELCRMYPELNKYIDLNTGEIIGGTAALRDYVDEWYRLKTEDTTKQGFERKYAALEEVHKDIINQEAERSIMISAYANKWKTYGYASEEEARKDAEHWAKIGEITHKNWEDLNVWAPQLPTAFGDDVGMAIFRDIYEKGGGAETAYKFSTDVASAIYRAGGPRLKSEKQRGKPVNGSQQLSDLMDIYIASAELTTDTKAYEQGLKDLESAAKHAGYEMSKLAGTEENAAEAAAKAARDMEVEDLTKAVEDATDAIQDYYNSVRSNVASTVNGIVHAFDKVTTLSEAKMEDLEKKRKDLQEKADAEEDETKKKKILTQIEQVDEEIKTTSNGTTSAQQMINNLQSQVNYMSDYQAQMDAARAAGVSDEVLAELADGSLESYEYLKALAQADKNQIEEINRLYGEVNVQREGFVDSLTDTKLKVDSVWDQLIQKEEEAIEALKKASAAEDATSQTMTGLIDGIKNKYDELSGWVDTVNSKLSQLGRIGSGFTMTEGNITTGIDLEYNGSHASGLDYVPFDGYIAELHKGESILTREESKLWRNYMGSRNDYGSMAGAIWNSAPDLGGPVYLDGEIVGRIMSARQGDAYRRMERSGWRG